MASTAMTENLTAVKIDWACLSGVILDGGCELKDALWTRDDAAELRVRILGSGGRLGKAYFLQLAPKDLDDQLEIWQTLRDAPHTNLNRPLSVGKRQVGGIETVYLVLADPDEKLGAVIPERPLEWEEAAEVLHCCEKGLAHLHAFGLIHGSVSPDTVQAVGYTIQLDTAAVRRLGTRPRVDWVKARNLAPEAKEFNLTTAADVWCLGATLFEVLAQEPYGTPGAEMEQGLPLAAVIRRCLERDPITRCTLKEAPALEKSAPPSEFPATEPDAQPAAAATATFVPAAEAKTAAEPLESPRAKPVETRVPGTAPARGTGASRLPHPLAPKSPPRIVTKEEMVLVPLAKRHKKVQGKRQGVDARIRTLDGPVRENPDEPIALPGATVAAHILALGHKSNVVRGVVAGLALACLVVAAVWFVIIPKLQTPVQPPASAEISLPASLDSAKPSEGPAPSALAYKPVEAAPAGDASVPVAPKRPDFFRVVIEESSSQPEVLERQRKISQQYPEFFFQTVPARLGGGNGPNNGYYVVGGGLMTRNEADQLSQRMTAKGLKGVRIEPYARH